MPANNRKSSKSLNSKYSHAVSNNDNRVNSDDSHLQTALGSLNRILLPKHITLPSLPVDSELLFETIMFFYTTMALCLQHLNLYRTVWWLPHSHNKYAVNFYLIDLHLMAYIIIILGRRYVWCVLETILKWSLSPSSSTKDCILPFLQSVIRVGTGASLLWLIWCIAWKHPIVKMLYLLYPVCMYIMLFSTKISAFFVLLQAPNPLDSKIPKMKLSITSTSQVEHICSQSAEAVRKEVECLKTDFNNRLKQVLFNSLLSTYYAGFIPYCFAQSVLYYDSHWMTQQMICLWLSSFTMHVVYVFSPQYCNVLHCSALHLGRWHKVEGPAAHMPHVSWTDTILWQQGALVKHKKELFRAEGITNAAEPGNSAHCRFYIFFRDPSTILCGFVGLQMTLLISQIFLLAFSNEWNYIISHTLLIISNYYTLFKLIRDYLVLGKIYRTEDVLQNKIAT